MNVARTLALGALLLSAPAMAQDGGAPGALQVPTNAFFGSVTGTVAWPKGKNIGAPKDSKAACAKITVRAVRKDPAADGTSPPTVTELRSAPAKGAYPNACTFKLENVRIRQDVFLEATYPTDDWKSCKAAAFTSAPVAGAKWKNPFQLPTSQELKAPLALSVTCAK